MQGIYNALSAFGAVIAVAFLFFAVYAACRFRSLSEKVAWLESDASRNECRIDCLGNDVANHDTQLDIQQAATNTINGRIAALESPRLSVWSRIKGRLRYGR